MAEIVVFAQTQGRPEIVEVKVMDTITESELYRALETAGVLGTGEVFVFIEEAEQHVLRHENRPASGIHHGSRIHLTRCHHIRTIVHYQDRTIERNFPPGARVRSVKVWAVREFHLDHKDAAEHVLQISNSRERPSSDTPLHVLVPVGSCDLKFDLVPEKRIEGCDDYCHRA
jgi:hypothetical protein